MLDKKHEEIQRRRDAIEEMLQRIAGARTTLQELLMDESEAGGGPEGGRVGSGGNDSEPGSVGAPSASGTEDDATTGEDPDRGTRGLVEMEEARRRAVTLLAWSGRKMRARAIAEAIGEDVSRPARVETTRGRLKTLVAEGTLGEEPPGVFFIATSAGPVDAGPEPGGNFLREG